MTERRPQRLRDLAGIAARAEKTERLPSQRLAALGVAMPRHPAQLTQGGSHAMAAAELPPQGQTPLEHWLCPRDVALQKHDRWTFEAGDGLTLTVGLGALLWGRTCVASTSFQQLRRLRGVQCVHRTMSIPRGIRVLSIDCECRDPAANSVRTTEPWNST